MSSDRTLLKCVVIQRKRSPASLTVSLLQRMLREMDSSDSQAGRDAELDAELP
jgi:hypothetical protein